MNELAIAWPGNIHVPDEMRPCSHVTEYQVRRMLAVSLAAIQHADFFIQIALHHEASDTIYSSHEASDPFSFSH